MGNILQFSPKTLKPISPSISDSPPRPKFSIEDLMEWKIKPYLMKKDECDLSIEERLEMTTYELFLRKTEEKSQIGYHSAQAYLKLSKQRTEESFHPTNINFPILSCSIKKLIFLASNLIQEIKMIHQILKPDQITNLVTKIATEYNTVSYHNFSHAFSLMHFLYNCFKADKIFNALYSKEEMFFAFFAGLAHDINHNGTNNNFQVKMNSQLSKLANNETVLEKMHLRYFYQILDKNSSQNIIAKSKNKNKMKELLARTILATDILFHFSNLKLLQKKRSQGFDYKDQDERYFILEQVFHACDISNPCLEYQNYMNWAVLLSYQFKAQTELEQKNGIQVTKILKDGGKKNFLKGQIGFINGILFPLWKELSLSWNGFNGFVQNIQINLKELKQRQEKQQ